MNINKDQHPLVIKQLGVHYPGKEVLCDLDLTLKQGEVYGLLGRNGAGKTTLINTLMNLLQPVKGSITYWGDDMNAIRPSTWKRISYIGEMSGVLPHWRVERLVKLQQHSYGRIRLGWVNNLFRKFGIEKSSRMKELSKGSQQLVGLILAISVQSDLLILDEPASGLDPIARRDLLGKIFEIISLNGAQPCTTLISSHMISDLERIVDQVGFLSCGRIILEGGLDDLKENCALVKPPPGDGFPEGVKPICSCSDGYVLVSGDLEKLAGNDMRFLGLEDLYLELLGTDSLDEGP